MTNRCPLPNRHLAVLALLAMLPWLLNVAPATPAQAAGLVTNCTFQGLADAINSGNGLINFNCGPATITLTQTGGLNVDAGHFYTIDGGNVITLNGGDHNRLFNVKSGGALTLTNIILSNGFQGSDGYIPTEGGALLNNGGWLVLDHATVRDSQSTYAGGGIESAAGTTIITGSLIENNQSGFGGGIDGTSTLTVSNSTIRHNHAITDFGGGLNVEGLVTINNSLIFSNTADQGYGGGLNNLSGSAFGTLTITGSRLEANHAKGGGAVASGVPLSLTLSTLIGNSARTDGGGIYIGWNATLTRDTFSGNIAAYGGAIDNGAILQLDSATLNDNSAGSGGGVYNSSQALLTNVTLSANTAITGGGVYNNDIIGLWNVTLSGDSATTGGALYMSASSTTAVTNTILAKSPSGGDCAGTITAAKYSISSGLSCALSVTGGPGNHDNLDPLLTALGNYGGPTRVHMLKLGSPAIAGVVGNDAPSTDQRGQPRPGPDGNYDIGAVERQPTDSNLAPWLYVPLIVR